MTAPARLRLFVALELPAAVREALAAFAAAAADPELWRPVAPEALHLTLAFLGGRPADDVPRIALVLAETAGPAPRLALGGALLLPPRRARVLCAAACRVVAAPWGDRVPRGCRVPWAAPCRGRPRARPAHELDVFRHRRGLSRGVRGRRLSFRPTHPPACGAHVTRWQETR